MQKETWLQLVLLIYHSILSKAASVQQDRKSTRLNSSNGYISYAVFCLKKKDGVGDINVFGAREYSMRIWLDPHQLSARGLTAQDVVTAIKEQNVQVAARSIGAPPVAKGATAFQYTVSTQGRLTDEKQFGEIIVKTAANGQVTR